MSTEETLRLTVAALMMRTGERQADLAAGIGQKQTQVSRKLSGGAHWSLEDVDRLAAHYGMPVLDLLAGPTHAAGRLDPARLRTVGAQALVPLGQAVTAPAPARRKVSPPPSQAEAAVPPASPPPAPTPAPEARVAPVAPAALPPDRTAAGRLVEAEAAPCVVCGVPTVHRAGGRPQHFAYGMCAAAPAPDADQLAPDADQLAPDEDPAPAPTPAVPVDAPPTRPRRTPGHAAGSLADMIARRVTASLRDAEGDIDAAVAALVKTAIPDVMELFRASRVGGRYEHSDFPPSEDILKKRSQKGADMIWEGRPKWRNDPVVKAARAGAEPLTVHRLDMNAAYLAAMKTHLPIGKLVHDTTGVHNTKRSGVHLITPPEWDHTDLPSPLGSRKEPGDLWVTEATLRLLFRCARLDLCAAPVIRESWTSGSTEGLLEKLRRALADARKNAIENGDEVTTEYVKAMYSKFVSTLGESTSNREIRRPDWMHTIRSQAFANLWLKAHKAHTSGLLVLEMSGTDELHVAGDWKSVFREGRNLDQVKEKGTYTLGGN
ncbi:helix-turn-helix domain-containing protein [Streptomyces sp. DW26H14]|uniref:helix-turn-helix domain-containing protein n=1 Tax=Streptomyces sp. DW26H14 TaxID=3435395 RepID=UPI00403D9426